MPEISSAQMPTSHAGQLSSLVLGVSDKTHLPATLSAGLHLLASSLFRPFSFNQSPAKRSAAKILGAAAEELAAASSFAEVAGVAARAVPGLLPESTAHLLADDVPSDNQNGELSSDKRSAFLLMRHPAKLRFELKGAGASILGFLEVESRCDAARATARLTPLLGLLTVALQKVGSYTLLLKERSARERLDTELGKAERAREEFLATISHELRTPLNSLLGWCQLLRHDNLNRLEKEEALMTIERSIRTEARLIDNLVDFSRLVSGQVGIAKEPVDVTRILSRAIKQIRPVLGGKDQRLETYFLGTLPIVAGDEDRLHQIFWNLLTNASKFTPVGGCIKVTTRIANGYVEIDVNDNGQGINADYLPYLFSNFSQEDGSYTRAHGGLGLGLAVVRYLVQLHGGQVTAASPGRDLGATFTVSLPRHKVLPCVEAISRPTKSLLRGLRVLIVDDDPCSLRLLQIMLEDCGATVRAVTTSAAAWSTLTTWIPDLLLSDIGLPGEDGNSLIRRIRTLPPERGGSVPAFAISAYASPSDQSEALAAGFQKHLKKPLDRQKLLINLRTFVALAKNASHPPENLL